MEDHWLKWVGRLNFWVFQWFGVRVYGTYADEGRRLDWGLLWPVLPLSGWKFFGRSTRFWPPGPKAIRLG